MCVVVSMAGLMTALLVTRQMYFIREKNREIERERDVCLIATETLYAAGLLPLKSISISWRDASSADAGVITWDIGYFKALWEMQYFLLNINTEWRRERCTCPLEIGIFVFKT